jgi:hypothetical protein
MNPYHFNHLFWPNTAPYFCTNIDLADSLSNTDLTNSGH